MGLKNRSSGRITSAPALRAACPMPVSAKQLAGSLMGLSVTATDAAPAVRHRRVSSATMSGWVVADSIGGEAKAAFTLSRTRSPLRTKVSIPPSDCSASCSVRTRSDPCPMHIFFSMPRMEKSGRAAAWGSAAAGPGPAGSWVA